MSTRTRFAKEAKGNSEMVYSSKYNLFLLKIFCQRLFIHSFIHSFIQFQNRPASAEAVFETMTISSTFVDEENASLLFSISMLFLCSPSWVGFCMESILTEMTRGGLEEGLEYP